MSRIQFSPQHVNLPVGGLAATGEMFKGYTGSPADLPRLAEGYNAAYQGALGFNSSLLQNQQRLTEQLGADAAAANAGIAGAYAGITGAAGDLRTTAMQQNQDINQRYGQLSSDVLGGIRGIEQSRLTDINDQFARDQAAATQSLASRGLGNTTVVDSVNRGLGTDRDRARTRLANEIADLTAGYQSRLGLAGLEDLRRGQEQGIDLGREQLGWMGRGAAEQVRAQEQQVGLGRDFLGYLSQIQAPYPDAGMFAALAQQAGTAGQADADRGLLMQQLAGMQRTAQQATQAAGEPTFSSPSAGGGFMGGTGRGLSGPEANYGGGTVQYGSGIGTPAVGTVAPPVMSLPLQGAGGGYSVGGLDIPQSGFGGGVSAGGLVGTGGVSAADYLAGGGQVAAGQGGFGAYGGGSGFGGGFGGQTLDFDFDELLYEM